MSNILTEQASPKATQLVSFIALLFFMPFLILGSREVMVLLTRATGKPANIVVNTAISLETLNSTFYHAFAQGGEESTDMLRPISAQIRALKPSVIRLDHLYDHYNVVGRSGNDLTFDWTRLDAAVDTILATGAKPTLALSYMPPIIAKDGNIIGPPDKWEDWALVVQKTIEHYSGKTAKNIPGIYYEVWNEPDLAQFGAWKYYGEKSYVTLYHYAAVGAARAKNINTFYLGGPSTTGLYQNWIVSLVKGGDRIDFFSWHTYQADPDKYDKDQENLISWLLPYPGYTLLPKLITEFGFTGDKSALYGSTYAAAHTAAVIRKLISGGPTYLYSFQLKDGPNQESGNGWGLIGHETAGGKAKPRYSVYGFLDSCLGQRVSVRGEGSWVTGFATRRDNTVRLCLINFDTRGTHTENVPISFEGLENGTYLLRQKFFLGLDATVTETVSEGILSKKIFMPASSILLLELTKQPAT